jgi:hypothetical protein
MAQAYKLAAASGHSACVRQISGEERDKWRAVLDDDTDAHSDAANRIGFSEEMLGSWRARVLLPVRDSPLLKNIVVVELPQ